MHTQPLRVSATMQTNHCVSAPQCSPIHCVSATMQTQPLCHRHNAHPSTVCWSSRETVRDKQTDRMTGRQTDRARDTRADSRQQLGLLWHLDCIVRWRRCLCLQYKVATCWSASSCSCHQHELRPWDSVLGLANRGIE
jgi:hypothetical protein